MSRFFFYYIIYAREGFPGIARKTPVERRAFIRFYRLTFQANLYISFRNELRKYRCRNR